MHSPKLAREGGLFEKQPVQPCALPAPLIYYRRIATNAE